MPRNSSAWVDIRVHLIVVVGLLLILMLYNRYVAFFGLILLALLFVYAKERCNERQRAMEEYYNNVVKNINELSNYAIDNLPIAIVVLNHQGRMQWVNEELTRWMKQQVDVIGMDIHEFWPEVDVKRVWEKEGEFILSHEGRFYEVKHRPILSFEDSHGLMVFYVLDVTDRELLRMENNFGKKALAYIQIDNYDEVLQGLSETQRTQIIVEVNQLLDEWVAGIGAFLKRVSDDLYIAILDRRALDKMIEEKCDILDKVRAIHGANKFPVTLSMGIALESPEAKLAQLGELAQAGLDLALGRGGDQVAMNIDAKMQFFGGKAKAVEKHTRVKARVVSHALNEIIGNADLVLIMGHHNEDFDSFGAAMGVAQMARHLGKTTYIVLSDINTGIQKILDMLKEYEEYGNLFIHAGEAAALMAANPLLVVVDTHIPTMTAAPALLDRIENIIVIDHHRRSENFIVSPLLIYIEPSSSSTSELVTELMMYFSESLYLTRMDATSLYAGIVVDTKNFTIQSGVRTFDAAAYLRRSGADPAVVRHLFKSDYESAKAKSIAIGSAELLSGGLIVTVCPPSSPNAQITAAQVADAMLRIEDVRMSVVLFPMEDGVGVSARSNGELNVQVIMEQIGGGGHQNVAGAQVKDANIEELKEKVVKLSMNYIEESDKK